MSVQFSFIAVYAHLDGIGASSCLMLLLIDHALRYVVIIFIIKSFRLVNHDETVNAERAAATCCRRLLISLLLG